MLIQPDTDIRLIRNCPLDPNYEHTIMFNYKEDQVNYFKSLPGVSFAKSSYQRYTKGVLHLAASFQTVYNCNYMMFKNTAFENKWYYAFVTNVEYVNNNSCHVYYQLDVMQTWHFDYALGECFVEREHSVTDNPGDNLVHENIYFGPYVYENNKTFEDGGYSLEDLSVVIMYNPAIIDLVKIPENVRDFLYTENFYGGVYQGVGFIAIPALRANAELIEPIFTLVDFLSGGGLLSAFMMPTMFLPDRDEASLTDGVMYNKQVSLYLDRPSKIGSHTPKNKKLLTYPYTCAYLTSMRGGGNEFPFEYFGEDGKALFFAEGNLCSNPSVIAYPFGYKGVTYYLEGAVSIDNYPICTWGADGVTEWINNNLFKSLATVATTAAIGATISPAASVVTSGVMDGQASGVIGGQASLPRGMGELSALPLLNPGANNSVNIGGAIKGGIENINGAFNYALNTPLGALSAIGLARSEFDPGKVHGGVKGDILIGNINGRHIHVMIERITEQYAVIVDEYFTRFGYATNRVKVPNRTARPIWNYVKTSGCITHGVTIGGNVYSVPAGDAAIIHAIYDRGITFWNDNYVINGGAIGDYHTSDNSPQ